MVVTLILLTSPTFNDSGPVILKDTSTPSKLTVIVAVTEISVSFKLTLIVVEPSLCPVTTPVSEMVAIVSSVISYKTSVSAFLTVTIKFFSSPTFKVKSSTFKVGLLAQLVKNKTKRMLNTIFFI